MLFILHDHDNEILVLLIFFFLGRFVDSMSFTFILHLPALLITGVLTVLPPYVHINDAIVLTKRSLF